MPKKITTEIFIDRAKKIHNNKYDYSLVEYVNAISKVDIICPKHGIFSQTPNHHLRHHGCKICGYENVSDILKMNITVFIENAKKKHGNKYDYSLVEIIKNNKNKVKIICKTHGIFIQRIDNHLNGQCCPKCIIEQNSNKKRKTLKMFIEDSEVTHNIFYSYTKAIYINNKSKIKITCPIHGDFLQTPDNHLQGKGCKKCALISQRLRRIKEIEKDKFNGNQMIPSYNLIACELFDKISEEKNIHIEHAMNGGEFHIKELGYWVDGFDKENNTVYEYDEKYHKYQKEKDLIRENEIINHLKCEFIRIKEK